MRLYVRYAISIYAELIKVSQKSEKMQEGVIERVTSQYPLSIVIPHDARTSIE
jgi:hypothetical protein